MMIHVSTQQIHANQNQKNHDNSILSMKCITQMTCPEFVHQIMFIHLCMLIKGNVYLIYNNSLQTLAIVKDIFKILLHNL